MRLLLITEEFHRVGGVQETVERLSAALAQRGHQVLVVSMPFDGTEAVHLARPAAACLTLAVAPRYKPITWRHLERLFKNDAGSAELAGVIRRWAPDLVNCHVWSWDRFQPVALACRKARVKLAITLYDCNPMLRQPHLQSAVNRALECARAVIAVSQATARQFAGFAPAAAQARVIHCGVELAAADAAEAYGAAHPYLFCASRLALESKALDLLLAAFSGLLPDYPELRLLIAGEGDDRAALESQIAALGLGGRAELLGACPRRQLYSLFKGAVLFVLPSRMPEGLGIAHLEAMACGVPVVATNSGGTPEIVKHGRCGLLVEPDSPIALAAAIRTLLDDAARRLQMGAEGRRLAAGFDWSNVARQYERVYLDGLNLRRF